MWMRYVNLTLKKCLCGAVLFLKEPPLRMNLIVEPHIIALGPNHVATAMNDRVWVYEVGTSGKTITKFEGKK